MAAIRKAVQRPATVGSWEVLPLFSWKSAVGITAADLHASYRPSAPLHSFHFSTVASQALKARNITSLGELLLTPAAQLLDQYRGVGTLSTIQRAVAEFMTYSIEDGSPLELDWSTPENFVDSLVRHAATDKRERVILLGRMRSEPRTLEDLGQEFGLTRERVRQLEARALRRLVHWRTGIALRPLHDLIRDMLKTASPMIDLAAVGTRLQRRCKWQRPLAEEALARTIRAFPDLKCVDGRFVCLRLLRENWLEQGCGTQGYQDVASTGRAGKQHFEP